MLGLAVVAAVRLAEDQKYRRIANLTALDGKTRGDTAGINATEIDPRINRMLVVSRGHDTARRSKQVCSAQAITISP
jgi:hypothetical protein